jgi:hypothetical protein
MLVTSMHCSCCWRSRFYIAQEPRRARLPKAGDASHGRPPQLHSVPPDMLGASDYVHAAAHPCCYYYWVGATPDHPFSSQPRLTGHLQRLKGHKKGDCSCCNSSRHTVCLAFGISRPPVQLSHQHMAHHDDDCGLQDGAITTYMRKGAAQSAQFTIGCHHGPLPHSYDNLDCVQHTIKAVGQVQRCA